MKDKRSENNACYYSILKDDKEPARNVHNKATMSQKVGVKILILCIYLNVYFAFNIYFRIITSSMF